MAEWGSAIVLFTSLSFAPLVAQGLLDDLLRGLGVAAYGGPYSKASLAGALTILDGELRSGWTFALVASLMVLWLFDGQTESQAGADLTSRRRRRAPLSDGAPGSARVPGASAGPVRLDCPGPSDGAGCVDVLARPAIAAPGRHADPLRGDTARYHFLCPTSQRPRTRLARSLASSLKSRRLVAVSSGSSRTNAVTSGRTTVGRWTTSAVRPVRRRRSPMS